MSDAKWRGVDKPGGAHFYAPDKVSNHGVDCPLLKIGTLRCYGTLKKHPTKKGWAVCDDCRASFPPTLLKIFKIDPEKFR